MWRAAAAGAIVALVGVPLAVARVTSAPGQALERVLASGRFTLGYRTDAPPFSYRDDSGKAAGYTVALCQRVADALKADLGLSGMTVEWVPVTVDTRFQAVRAGTIDLLCGAETATLVRRREIAFSIPIFPGGIGALVRKDAPARLRQTLAGEVPANHPVWRGSASQALHSRRFLAVNGTTSAGWLVNRIDALKVVASTSLVDNYAVGVQDVVNRRADALFGERGTLMDAARRQPSNDLMMIDRLFTCEPLALGLARGDEDFRLFVDRALSRIYRLAEIDSLYATSFGEPSETVLTFIRWSALPE